MNHSDMLHLVLVGGLRYSYMEDVGVYSLDQFLNESNLSEPLEQRDYIFIYTQKISDTLNGSYITLEYLFNSIYLFNLSGVNLSVLDRSFFLKDITYTHRNNVLFVELKTRLDLKNFEEVMKLFYSYIDDTFVSFEFNGWNR